MALMEHPIVEAGLARLAGFWPALPRHGANLRPRPTSSRPTDAAAAARASAIYAGHDQLSPEDFANLTWLPDFAHSGKQLLLGHALTLLQGWSQQRFIRNNLADDAAILSRLSQSAGAFAAHLQPLQLQPLSAAFHKQMSRLQAHRTSFASDILLKALALLEATAALQEADSLRKETTRLLEHAVPQLVGLDGGPTAHSLTDYCRWLGILYAATEQPLGLHTHNALDRARPFLAMLLTDNEHYCFNPALSVPDTVQNTAPLQLAPASQVARLMAGKMAVISLPRHTSGSNALCVSSHGKALIEVGLFQHDDTENAALTFLSSHTGDAGHLLQLATQTHQRMVFLSPSGEDLRVEDRLPADGLPRWLQLKLSEDAKVSITRTGTEATIVGAKRSLWQLSLRGAKFIQHEQSGQLVLHTNAKAQVNWALKRINRNTARSPKTEMPELPF
jgi:hypothetical protein